MREHPNQKWPLRSCLTFFLLFSSLVHGTYPIMLNHRVSMFLEEPNLSTNVRVYNVYIRDFIQWCLTLYMINIDDFLKLHTLSTGDWRIDITPEIYQDRVNSQSLLFLNFLNFLFLLYSCIPAWFRNHNRLWAFWMNGLFFYWLSQNF